LWYLQYTMAITLLSIKYLDANISACQSSYSQLHKLSVLSIKENHSVVVNWVSILCRILFSTGKLARKLQKINPYGSHGIIHFCKIMKMSQCTSIKSAVLVYVKYTGIMKIVHVEAIWEQNS
jgi:hypothetical protein